MGVKQRTGRGEGKPVRSAATSKADATPVARVVPVAPVSKGWPFKVDTIETANEFLRRIPEALIDLAIKAHSYRSDWGAAKNERAMLVKTARILRTLGRSLQHGDTKALSEIHKGAADAIDTLGYRYSRGPGMYLPGLTPLPGRPAFVSPFATDHEWRKRLLDDFKGLCKRVAELSFDERLTELSLALSSALNPLRVDVDEPVWTPGRPGDHRTARIRAHLDFIDLRNAEAVIIAGLKAVNYKGRTRDFFAAQRMAKARAGAKPKAKRSANK